jgi:hypothetical protein
MVIWPAGSPRRWMMHLVAHARHDCTHRKRALESFASDLSTCRLPTVSATPGTRVSGAPHSRSSSPVCLSGTNHSAISSATEEKWSGHHVVTAKRRDLLQAQPSSKVLAAWLSIFHASAHLHLLATRCRCRCLPGPSRRVRLDAPCRALEVPSAMVLGRGPALAALAQDHRGGHVKLAVGAMGTAKVGARAA